MATPDRKRFIWKKLGDEDKGKRGQGRKPDQPHEEPRTSHSFVRTDRTKQGLRGWLGLNPSPQTDQHVTRDDDERTQKPSTQGFRGRIAKRLPMFRK